MEAVVGERPSSGTPDFGRLLLRLRVAAGLSQEALAERARISVDAISALERGTRRRPRFDTVALLVRALELEDGERRAFEAAAHPPSPARLAVADPDPARALDNLPTALSRFVGRETELTKIVALVRDRRLVTLTGTGGIGKTRTALEAAAAVSSEFDGGVWLIELAPVADAALVGATIASTLGVRARPEHSLLETLIAYFRHKTLLLVLDNCEHVVAEAARITEVLLRACPNLRVLATCREPLAIAGEQTYRLPSLDAPLPEDAHQLRPVDAERYSAVALFAERAQAVDQRFVLTPENVPIVAEICRRLDGIPLAIELAAARVKLLPVRALSERLDQRFALLTGGSRTALPRQQTLRALIDWSHALLNERERRCFAALSVFAGRFSLEAATHVCAERDEDTLGVLDVVASLADKSLVLREADGETFRQLETTRYYAAEKLREMDAEEECARRHLDYYLSVCESDAAPSGPANGRAWLADVRGLLDNLRAAVRWSVDLGRDVRSGIELTASFCTAWMALALDAECSERIHAALRACDDETPTALRARLHLALAQIAIRSQRSAIVPAREAVALYALTDHDRGQATALNALGYALSRENRCDEADRCYEQALALAERVNDVRQWGLALLNLGVNRENANDFERTRQLYESALALAGISGDDYLVGAANLDLSVLCEVTDAPEAGYSYARQAFAAFERAGDTNGSALALGNMTTNLIGLGRIADARTAARDYVQYARTYRLDTIFIIALEKVAAIAQSAGDLDACAQLLGFTAARAAALDLKRDPGNLRFTDGLLRQLHEGRPDETTEWLAQGALLSETAAADLALSLVSEPPASLTSIAYEPVSGLHP